MHWCALTLNLMAGYTERASRKLIVNKIKPFSDSLLYLRLACTIPSGFFKKTVLTAFKGYYKPRGDIDIRELHNK